MAANSTRGQKVTMVTIEPDTSTFLTETRDEAMDEDEGSQTRGDNFSAQSEGCPKSEQVKEEEGETMEPNDLNNVEERDDSVGIKDKPGGVPDVGPHLEHTGSESLNVARTGSESSNVAQTGSESSNLALKGSDSQQVGLKGNKAKHVEPRRKSDKKQRTLRDQQKQHSHEGQGQQMAEDDDLGIYEDVTEGVDLFDNEDYMEMMGNRNAHPSSTITKTPDLYTVDHPAPPPTSILRNSSAVQEGQYFDAMNDLQNSHVTWNAIEPHFSVSIANMPRCYSGRKPNTPGSCYSTDSSADGACRHIAASLFEIEAFEPQSCTDGENKWQRRPRQHDEPVPIQSLKIHTARYRMSVSETDREHPYCDTFDPRQAIHMNGPGEEDMKKFTQQLLQINPNIQVLETLMEPMDIDHSETNEPLTTMDHQCLELSMKLKADQFIMERCTSSSTTNTPQDFINSLNFSQEDIEYIENSTRGQSENGNWFEMRKGLITASNFSRVTRHMQSGRRAPSLLQELTDGDSSQECRSEALDWGRKKEKVAKSLYKKALHKVHKRLTIKETGLVVSAEHPFLACSPDGVVSCKCKASGHEPRLIEVKCPYNSRTISAKQAALVKGCVEANGCLSLTEQSEFYHQVQGQLGICGHTLCHLVIYTTKGIEVIEVKFNPEFYKSMTSYLSDYFKTEMVPALLHLDVDNEQDID